MLFHPTFSRNAKLTAVLLQLHNAESGIIGGASVSNQTKGSNTKSEGTVVGWEETIGLSGLVYIWSVSKGKQNHEGKAEEESKEWG